MRVDDGEHVVSDLHLGVGDQLPPDRHLGLALEHDDKAGMGREPELGERAIELARLAPTEAAGDRLARPRRVFRDRGDARVDELVVIAEQDLGDESQVDRVPRFALEQVPARRCGAANDLSPPSERIDPVR
ncbi:MAG TPA: hypothetical protein VMU73_02880 [Gaiellaceae bacterium]|nr:hypothetical protein [Gaiellaceae bacterium]